MKRSWKLEKLFFGLFCNLFKHYCKTLFIFELVDSLWFHINYREFNAKMIKNRYFLPLINEIFDRLSSAPVFTNIDLKNANCHIQSQNND